MAAILPPKQSDALMSTSTMIEASTGRPRRTGCYIEQGADGTALPIFLRSPLLPRVQRRIFFGAPLPPLDPAFSFREGRDTVST
jgi:hypothetical protein